MSNILDRIVSVKKTEVEKAKTAFDPQVFRDADYFMERECSSLKDR